MIKINLRESKMSRTEEDSTRVKSPLCLARSPFFPLLSSPHATSLLLLYCYRFKISSLHPINALYLLDSCRAVISLCRPCCATPSFPIAVCASIFWYNTSCYIIKLDLENPRVADLSRKKYFLLGRPVARAPYRHTYKF
jgi:hypothetical protein